MTQPDLKVCLLCTEIFAWGKFGGFGRATRLIGRELAKRGVETSAIVPRRTGQDKVEILDGIKVFGFDLSNPPEMLRIYKESDANLYHSQEPSFATLLAELIHPDKKHVVTFRDTRLMSDWITEFRFPSLNKFQVLANWLYEDSFLVRYAIRRADKRVAAAHLLTKRAQDKYGLPNLPSFLPTPVEIPEKVVKDKCPTVCYIGRWDRRKRLELMFDLIRSNPDVNFIIAGGSRDNEYDQFLRAEFNLFSNVELPGFINQFESEKISEILDRSWIQVNTAAREGLPNSFIEGCARKCAILSSVDPDGFSSRFGKHVLSNKFHENLAELLTGDLWKELGEKGYDFVKQTFSLEAAIQEHIDLYQTLLRRQKVLS